MRALWRFVPTPGPSAFSVALVGLGATYLVVLAWSMSHASFDVWGGILVAPFLIALTVPLALSAAKADGTSRTARLVMAAVLLKLVGSVVRYYVSFSVYGAADATLYHQQGKFISASFRDGDFAVDIGRKVAGTGFIDIVTGSVYTVTGASKLAGFFVFAWLGFVGLFLFYRAFRIAFPEGDARRYGLLVFFLPSLLFWPSSIGKESWMMLCLGVMAYGTARILARQPWGVPAVVLGAFGTAIVRPHVTLIAMVALFAAYLLRPASKESVLGPVAKIAMLGVLAVGLMVVASQMESFFGVSVLDQGGADQVLERASLQSDEGGSAFEAARPTSPVGAVQAAVAVVFRPWPYEVHNAQALLASMEGMLLLGLALTSLSRLASVPRAMLKRPYVAYALLFSLSFAYAFASIGNFGILSRQRVQLYPFLVVLICVPAGFGRSFRESSGEEAATSYGEPVALP
jgi:hypothetical protein